MFKRKEKQTAPQYTYEVHMSFNGENRWSWTTTLCLNGRPYYNLYGGSSSDEHQAMLDAEKSIERYKKIQAKKKEYSYTYGDKQD